MTPAADPVVCVVGPTASGKSDLAQRIAAAIGGEVVSADSMQIYRGMDIGTGKVAPSDRIVPHWGLDIADPGQPYSAALFQAYARERFADIAGRGRRAVLCGGTGFYVRAAIDDYDFPAGEQESNPVRERYRAFLEQHGQAALWQLLEGLDGESARVIPVADSKRVIRALELREQGESYAEQKRKLAKLPQLVPAVLLGLQVDPDELRRRIDSRVDRMVEEGLVGEVEALLDRGFREGLCAPQAIGYKEIVRYLDGGWSLDEAVEAIKAATRRYAKRQRTWFRKDARIRWLDATDGNLDRLADEALSIVADGGGGNGNENGCGRVREGESHAR